VRQHFQSIDHEILLQRLQRLQRRMPESQMMALARLITDSGAEPHEADYEPLGLPGDDLLAVCRPRGLPIGSLSSQC